MLPFEAQILNLIKTRTSFIFITTFFYSFSMIRSSFIQSNWAMFRNFHILQLKNLTYSQKFS